ncbi:MAG: hypothetical protein SFT94_05950 [Pseudanabaenaceae cyanobacterium bins.68]|nr:hypothetical protein [Pseudanabaenaceae cyanobacterium bins.68]
MGRIPKIFVFDRSAILATNVHFWQAIAESGQCLIPQLILDEINQAADQVSVHSVRSQNSALEFVRYLPNSPWQVTDQIKTHPSLVSRDQSLSRAARLSTITAQYAYGVAEACPEHLTILVTNDQQLIRRINQLQLDYLCGITAIAAREWAFSHKPPSGLGRAEANFKLGQKLLKHGFRSITYRDHPNWHSTFANLIGVLGIVLLGGLVGLVVWQETQPQEFEKFRRQYNLPSLPKNR